MRQDDRQHEDPDRARSISSEEPHSLDPRDLERLDDADMSQPLDRAPELVPLGPEDTDEPDPEEVHAIVHGNDPEAHLWNAVEHAPEPVIVRDVSSAAQWSWRTVRTDGFQFVLSFAGLILSLGLLGLALALANMKFTLPTIVLSLICVIWFVIRWRIWLANAPYCYRLLTSLGENADNLVGAYLGAMLRRWAERQLRRSNAAQARRDALEQETY
jgi:hypothetical protein